MSRLLKILAFIFAFFAVLILAFGIYVWSVSNIEDPEINIDQVSHLERTQIDSFTYVIGDNWITKNKNGLYEMYVSGNPLERGFKNGRLSKELIEQQEIAFTNQIKEMIPSEKYLKFLKYIIGFMNRNLSNHVIQEYQEEIYGVSRSAPDRFQWIGSNYSRMLNYHAAHDIGHALQNLMLVGCTSFAAWDGKTEEGAMILGRNFDFWVGDEFAENKIVEFISPDQGFDFAFITWGGFTGVVSGMNNQGLTVTINAAKSGIPFQAATPVSLVAREILQYASNIKEAIEIAGKREMFISESFLIGSAKDGKSVVIEKTPEMLAVFDQNSNSIICSNHYQSEALKNQQLNQEQMKESASVYRFQRTQELLEENFPLSPEKVAHILRDTKGKNNEHIGFGNEKAINQLIAHHAVIFMPDSLRMWVSTAPWQLGEFVCYDLRKVFEMDGFQKGTIVADTIHNINADPFLETREFEDFVEYRKYKSILLNDSIPIDIPHFVSLNPELYDTYRIAGDYYFKLQDFKQAQLYYELALSKEIATEQERMYIVKKINELP